MFAYICKFFIHGSIYRSLNCFYNRFDHASTYPQSCPYQRGIPYCLHLYFRLNMYVQFSLNIFPLFATRTSRIWPFGYCTLKRLTRLKWLLKNNETNLCNCRRKHCSQTHYSAVVSFWLFICSRILNSTIHMHDNK